MAPSTISALGMALKGKSASVDIPKPRDNNSGRDNLTAVPSSSSQKRGNMLLTPPSSISPNLRPQNGRRAAKPGVPMSSVIAQLDSDMELREEPAQSQPQPNALNAEALDSLGDLDSAGAITPGLLAKHHLPDILLSHGPLAIRHIMGYLTTSVPGFSRITSAKARRLVVAALEGRGNGAEGGGGVDGDVIFEKVGWGRWDARVKGQPPRDRQTTTITPPGSLPSSYTQAHQAPGQPSWKSGSDRLGTSFTGNSAAFSHSEMEYEDQDMLENEADKMSLDGNEAAYASSEAPEMMDEDMDEGEVTDEEDWASIGAEALRARSLPNSARTPSIGGRLYQPIPAYSAAPRHRSKTPLIAHSVPTKPIPMKTSALKYSYPTGSDAHDSQERAAIEALLSLGSM